MILMGAVLWPLTSPAEFIYSTDVDTPGTASAIVESGGRLGALFFNPDVDRELDAVQLRLSGSGLAEIQLYSSTGGEDRLPDAEISNLGSFELPGGLQTPTFAGGGTLLEADTYYWIVLVAHGPSFSTPAWSYTNTAGTGDGFVFGRALSYNGDPEWYEINATTAFKMEIFALPEPSAAILAGLGAMLCCIRRRAITRRR